ncbi:C-type lectin-like domain-containing protein [Chryseobacterium culicis]|uniref:C-type lectin domain-containing protein n=1 Tax=Chryseobacterium culicis TaxID=680127 RepID=A0A1H6IR31_CHRCI|nr:hypothetical protein [Chryseobacterium culicis]SEH49080.1 hypothetical protein SAMN05421593_0095 [Chryseobacterium culicis]
MKVKIIIVLLILQSRFFFTQVGINTANPGSTLDVKGSFSTNYKVITSVIYNILKSDQYIDFRGNSPSAITLPQAQIESNFGGRIYEIRNGSNNNIVLLPHGSEKIDVSKNANAQSSLIIPSGYYAMVKSTGNTSGSTWVVSFFPYASPTDSGIIKFSPTILGYVPTKASQRKIPLTFNGVSVAEKGCKKWDVNGHTYCAYQLGGGKSFYETFNLGKQIGGYIITMTSNDERNWVYTNILAPNSGFNFNNNIWIGYNKVANPGNPTAFTWITGEEWTIDWTTSPNSTPQSFFAAGEPNNNQGIEGSCHIYTNLNSTSRQWNDLNGNVTNFAGADFDQVILEFNED